MDIDKLLEMQQSLMDHVPHGHKIKDEHQAIVVAALGIVEETMEYLSAIGVKSWRPNPLPREDQLEEITDILFFVLELMILSGFSLKEIETQYYKKHKENLLRYEKAKKGIYDWDLRGEKEGL